MLVIGFVVDCCVGVSGWLAWYYFVRNVSYNIVNVFTLDFNVVLFLYLCKFLIGGF